MGMGSGRPLLSILPDQLSTLHSDQELRVALVGDTIRVVVEDEGSWLPPSARPDRGRGLQLMRALMSSVEVDPGPHGTRVALERRLLVPVAEPPVTTGR